MTNIQNHKPHTYIYQTHLEQFLLIKVCIHSVVISLVICSCFVFHHFFFLLKNNQHIKLYLRHVIIPLIMLTTLENAFK